MEVLKRFLNDTANEGREELCACVCVSAGACGGGGRAGGEKERVKNINY